MTHSVSHASILVVDDDKSMRFLIQESLSSLPFDIHEAPRGKDALAMLEYLQPTLLILDVRMPDMDGFELCKHIRAMDGFKDVPILMMTGLRDMESIQKAFESGATDFITKPVNWV
ncbi:MAG: response regulator, partial [Ghiorsea sp.]